MRVVLDTNVLLSAILFGGIARRVLTLGIDGRIRLITAPGLLDEFDELLERKFGFSRSAASSTRVEFEVLVEVVDPIAIPNICRDPDDDLVLATAIEGAADLIVTGDQDLLALTRHEGIEILRPAQALKRLESPGEQRP